MENIELYKISLKEQNYITEIRYKEDKVEIVFGKESIEFESVHEQDCCEQVYADFEILKHYEKQLTSIYKEIIIKAVPEMGILLHFVDVRYELDEKVFIPCYNEQNGYYSDKLAISIKHDGIKKVIDITKYKQDKIDG